MKIPSIYLGPLCLFAVITQLSFFVISNFTNDLKILKSSVTCSQSQSLFLNPKVQIIGLSLQESWGRWTDAAIFSQGAKFTTDRPLPRKFILEFNAKAFGPNAQGQTLVKVGNKSHLIIVGSEYLSPYRLEFDSVNFGARSIVITPPIPISPNKTNPTSVDTRLLGVGFSSVDLVSASSTFNSFLRGCWF